MGKEHLTLWHEKLNTIADVGICVYETRIKKHEFTSTSTLMSSRVEPSVFSTIADPIHFETLLTIRNVMDVFKVRLQEHDIDDPRKYDTLRKLVKRFLQKDVQEISFETYSHT